MKGIKYKISIFFFLTTIGISSVYAYNLCQARNVTYSPKDTSWNVSNVQEAISDLYKTKCGGANSCGDIAEPKLYDDDAFIPVTIDDDGTVRYADTSTNWYDYCEKRWANAVMLNKYISISSNVEPGKITIDTANSDIGYVNIDDENRFEEIPKYKPGEIIKESDIQSYFVWIPKYKYKLWNVNSDGKSTGITKGVHSIDIVFDKTNTTDVEGESCATPLGSGETGNCNNGEYMTHPAFISDGVDGFWVAKFEASDADKIYQDDDSTQNQINLERGVSAKPNHVSKTSIKIQVMFETAYNYARLMDSHMMKNTEWGAVAYLSHSKYGINKKININNSKPKLTGASALPNTNQQTYPGTSGEGEKYYNLYNTNIGYLASTTGNITGVYDMSGGAQEYVAAYVDTKFSSSGFTAATAANYDAKYFDIYNKSSNTTNYQYRILGDATAEVGPFKSFIDNDGDTTATTTNSRYHSEWYRGGAEFATTSSSWFIRGNRSENGVLASQFSFQRNTGAANVNMGYRLVLD